MSGSSKIVIQGENITLKYFLPHVKNNTLKGAVLSCLKHGNRNKEFFALQNISFKVKQGETFGIIGDNGSGKTTLLKIISGILKPDFGSLKVQGNISALLELGAGFHPDLSGRDNIYLNGSIMGLARHEIDKVFEEIVAFSEVGEFLDTPLKHYSSGMYVRLGFSIATIFDSDILLIDETLAVGDLSFQEKCFKKFKEFKEKGKTIIFVSHDLRTVKHVCNRAICLNKGKIVFYGETGEVISDYINFNREKNRQDTKNNHPDIAGSKKVEILNVEILDKNETAKEEFNTGESLVIKVHFQVHRKIDDPIFGIAILRKDGVYVYGPNTREDNVFRQISFDHGEKGYFKIIYDKIPLLSGEYVLHIGIFDKNEIEVYDFVQNIHGFKVRQKSGNNIEGLVLLDHLWEVDKEEPGHRYSN